MTSSKRNITIIALMLVLLAASGYVIATKPTVLGLDLKGGVELVYEGRGTPKQPTVTPASIDDAIKVIRKRTDSLGVSEPEIQRAGSNQISIGLPNVNNADRAAQQVGTTAQLQFYDWEPNVIAPPGKSPVQAQNEPLTGSTALFDSVKLASKQKPKAEPTDLPPDGATNDIKQRFGNDKQKIEQYYDQKNDSSQQSYYLFGPDQKVISGPDSTCKELLSDFESVKGKARGAKQIPKGSKCRAQLKQIALGDEQGNVESRATQVKTGPPAASQVLAVPRGIVVVAAEQNAKASKVAQASYYVLEDDSELDGTQIKNPEQTTDQSNAGEPVVTMQFTDSGQKAFARATKREAQRGSRVILPPGATEQQRQAAEQKFAITLDGKIVSLASINFRKDPEGIDGRDGAQITGIGDLQQTQDLAESLRIGALPITLKLISQTQVSATLGQQALNQGLLAGGLGLLLTVLFLLLFYRVLGAVAATALVLYAVLLFAIAKLIPITLTLPGVAGLVLTLGVAADANVVIFERIKEEARAGRSIPAAISNGYAKALRTIVDANVVTIGVAFILFTLATAGVKGFAFTLGIGTIVSLFTAVLATSAILGAMSRTALIGSRFAIGATQTKQRFGSFDFIGKAKWFFSASGTILVIGALAIAGLGIKFGIDFESGTRIKTPVTQNADVDQVRSSLDKLGLGDAKIQKVDEPDLGRHVFQIATKTLDQKQVTQVRERLDGDFGGVTQAKFNTDVIGPTFGAQIARTALIAIVVSLLLISLYIALRFEWKFAVPVLIALSHDILITSGVYAIVGREVTTSTVAALLTILGYSLYDTIIVFDRIRENVPRMPRATFSQIVNRSMSEVLTRSLVTSLSTLLPVGALMLFGGDTLRDFAFALLVGILSGAYSSIFIASPVVTLWKEREPIYVRRRKLIMDENGGHVPAFATGKMADADPETSSRAQRRRRGMMGDRGGTPPPTRHAEEEAEGEARRSPRQAPPTERNPQRDPSRPPPARGPKGIRGDQSDGPDDDGGNGSSTSTGPSNSTGGSRDPKRGARASRSPKRHGRR